MRTSPILLFSKGFSARQLKIRKDSGHKKGPRSLNSSAVFLFIGLCFARLRIHGSKHTGERYRFADVFQTAHPGESSLDS